MLSSGVGSSARNVVMSGRVGGANDSLRYFGV